MCGGRPRRGPRDPRAGARHGPRARAEPQTPLLKPHGGYGARHVDAVAEEVGLAHLARLADALGCAIELLVDPATGATHRVGRGSRTVWASMDAIDGTVKVAGLGERLTDRVRVANDGGWAAGFAFTAPTEQGLRDLTFGDFEVAVVVDGNPTRYRSYPAGSGGAAVAGRTDHLGGHGAALAARVHDEQHRPVAALGVPRRLPGVRSRHATARRRRDRRGALPAPHRSPRRRRVRRAAAVRQSERARPRAVRLARAAGLDRVAGRRLPGGERERAQSDPVGAARRRSGRRVGGLRRRTARRERPLRAGRTSVLHAANEALCRRALALVAAARAAAGVAP